jgi:hypothetical protein
VKQAVADLIRQQLAMHGVIVPHKAALDTAAQLLMVLSDGECEPAGETHWRPADEHELEGHEHGVVFDATSSPRPVEAGE